MSSDGRSVLITRSKVGPGTGSHIVVDTICSDHARLAPQRFRARTYKCRNRRPTAQKSANIKIWNSSKISERSNIKSHAKPR